MYHYNWYEGKLYPETRFIRGEILVPYITAECEGEPITFPFNVTFPEGARLMTYSTPKERRWIDADNVAITAFNGSGAYLVLLSYARVTEGEYNITALFPVGEPLILETISIEWPNITFSIRNLPTHSEVTASMFWPDGTIAANRTGCYKLYFLEFPREMARVDAEGNMTLRITALDPREHGGRWYGTLFARVEQYVACYYAERHIEWRHLALSTIERDMEGDVWRFKVCASILRSSVAPCHTGTQHYSGALL